MGILLESVLKERESKRLKAIRELKLLDIHVTEEGKRVEDLDYDELMYEWRKAAFLAIDIEAEANKWY
jgi:hypothetical protein